MHRCIRGCGCAVSRGCSGTRAAYVGGDELLVASVSALYASGKTSAAREQLSILRQRGGVSPEIVRGLEQMLG